MPTEKTENPKAKEWGFYSDVLGVENMIAVSLGAVLLSPNGTGNLDFLTAAILSAALMLGVPAYFRHWYVNRHGYDRDLSARQMRNAVYDMWIPLSVGSAILFWLLKAPFIAAYCFATGIMLSAVSLLNNYTKISMHTTWISFAVVTLASAFGPDYWVFMLAQIPVVYLRLQWNKHTPAELLIGGILGSVIPYVIYGLA